MSVFLRRRSRVSSMSSSGPQLRLSTEELAAVRNYRRSSLAATLHANLIGLGGHPDAFDLARRRLSNVSDVVSRKISKTIGWRASVSVELTVSQGKSLCSQLMRSRMKRSGVWQRKLGMRRIPSSKLLGAGHEVVAEVSPVLNQLSAELEKMFPGLYERVGRAAGRASFRSEQCVAKLFAEVAQHMVRSHPRAECDWGLVVAIYSVAGGLAVDCVKQGKPEYLTALPKAMALLLEDEVAAWIQSNGGWVALANKCRPPSPSTEWQATKLMFVLISALLTLTIILYGIKRILL